jgi:hypothetical protein
MPAIGLRCFVHGVPKPQLQPSAGVEGGPESYFHTCLGEIIRFCSGPTPGLRLNRIELLSLYKPGTELRGEYGLWAAGVVVCDPSRKVGRRARTVAVLVALGEAVVERVNPRGEVGRGERAVAVGVGCAPVV